MASISKKIYQGSIQLSMVSFILFLVFYLLAALNYPGGSYADSYQVGFSFFDNYLCDLLDNEAINGDLNTAKIYARIALGFLCLGILLFWFHIPELFNSKSINSQIMRISGMTAMLITAFLAAGNHDVITRLAGLFGGIAMILAFISLYKAGDKLFFYFGLICLLLIIFNYYSYETGYLRPYLAFIQKVTTVGGLFWFALLNFKLYRNIDQRKNNRKG